MEHMREEKLDRQDATDAQNAPDDYVAPKLTDIGSFEELTQFGGGGAVDAEGMSA
jgi:hypothetical protein